MTRSTGFPSPLQGVRVLDISHVQAAPVCAMMLADMGAEVVKIESFGGDMFRQPMEGANFQNFNRNKRAIAIDLKTPEGLAIALSLAKQSDVLVENYLPGALERLGLGYEAIRALNPGIVYASISGFGQTGELRHRPAVEPIIQAMSGIMEATGDPDRAPVRVRPALIDYSTGACMAFAIAASLFRRSSTGQGEHIDIALLDVALYAMSPYITHYRKRGKVFSRTGSAHPATAPNQNFETADGFICIAASSDAMWRGLCKALAIESTGADPRFATHPLRARHRTEIAEIVNRETRKHSGAALESLLLDAGVSCAKIRSVAEIVEEPHIAQRGLLERTEHPTLGELQTLRTPIFLSGEAAPLRRRAPMIGEHTDEILAELGYDSAQVGDLVDRKIVIRYDSATHDAHASKT